MTIKSDSLPDGAISKFIGIAEVTSLTSLSRASVYRLTKEGDFPKAVLITKRRVAWRQQDIAAWMRSRFGEARAAALDGHLPGEQKSPKAKAAITGP